MRALVGRRRFIAGAGAMVLALVGWGAAAPRPEQQLLSLSRRLRELFDVPSLLEPLGERAVGGRDPGWTVEALAEELAEVTGWSADPAYEESNPRLDELAATLAEAVVRDFAAGDTLVVDGWLLSRTEVRLLALARLDPLF